MLTDLQQSLKQPVRFRFRIPADIQYIITDTFLFYPIVKRFYPNIVNVYAVCLRMERPGVLFTVIPDLFQLRFIFRGNRNFILAL